MVHSVSGVARVRLRGKWGGPLTPVARDCLSIRTRLPSYVTADFIVSVHLYRRAFQRDFGHWKAVAAFDRCCRRAPCSRRRPPLRS